MNIFYLDDDPRNAAQYACDKHVVKMILETAQLLSTAHHVLDNCAKEGLYKPTHQNHPSAVWVRQSHLHYEWLFEYWRHLHDEWAYRWRHSHVHKSWRTCASTLKRLPHRVPIGGFQQPPLCMPPQYHVPNAVSAYRDYYAWEKRHIATWTRRPIPKWYKARVAKVGPIFLKRHGSASEVA